MRPELSLNRLQFGEDLRVQSVPRYDKARSRIGDGRSAGTNRNDVAEHATIILFPQAAFCQLKKSSHGAGNAHFPAPVTSCRSHVHAQQSGGLSIQFLGRQTALNAGVPKRVKIFSRRHLIPSINPVVGRSYRRFHAQNITSRAFSKMKPASSRPTGIAEFRPVGVSLNDRANAVQLVSERLGE